LTISAGASDLTLARLSTRTRRPRIRWTRIFIYFFLSCGVVFVSFPFVWMLLTSFKAYAETTQLPPPIFPSVWHFDNYAIAWQSAPFSRYLINSTFIAACVVVGVLISSIFAAYAFAFMDFFGRNVVFVLFLSTMMIPFETILIPNFIIIRQLGWYNTYAALIIPWTGNVFSVFLIRQFFLSLPRDLVDAAVIDGCGHQRFLWWVAVPLARPAVTVVALFNFLWSWNGLLWPLIVTSSEELRPVQLGLSVFLTEDGASYQLLMAAATFTMLPIVVLYFVAQRQFIEGIAAGGVKG